MTLGLCDVVFDAAVDLDCERTHDAVALAALNELRWLLTSSTAIAPNAGSRCTSIADRYIGDMLQS